VSRLLAISAGLVAALLLLLWLTQRRMIYFPFGEVPTPAQVGLPRAEAVTFPTEDGLRLNAWFVPAPVDTRDVVLVFNGNAGNRAYRADLATAIAGQGFATLLFDYRGYGDNPGSPSEEGLARDARAARRYLETRADVDARRLVYFGESLGAGVAVGLALEHAPRALVLRSPFTSLTDVGRYHYPYLPVSWMLTDRFPSLDRIPRIGCPLLVIAGSRDSIIPASHSRRLFEGAREPKKLMIVEGADHNDDELAAGRRMIATMTEFLRGID
jgi:fermentation-respiration switch protein FrsA (DUF1100 family)